LDSVPTVLDALERGPALVIPLIKSADREVLKRRPSPGRWSIHEHGCHLAQVNPIFVERLDHILTQDQPVIRSYDPGRDDPEDALLSVDLPAALRRFESDRRELVARLRTLDTRDWQRTAEHDEYNSYSVFIMFRHLAIHDLFHAYRIEELVLKRDWPPPHA
jgi:hypothetical protein